MTLGILNRNREIIALKAAGVHAVTYAGPILVMSVLLALGHFGIAESIARPLNRQAEEIWQNRIVRQSNPSGWSKENVWFRGKDLIYQIRVYDQANRSLERVSLFFINDKFHLVRRLDAKRIRWAGNRWVAENGLVIQPQGSDQTISGTGPRGPVSLFGDLPLLPPSPQGPDTWRQEFWPCAGSPGICDLRH